jgi:hypothetical protein
MVFLDEVDDFSVLFCSDACFGGFSSAEESTRSVSKILTIQVYRKKANTYS